MLGLGSSPDEVVFTDSKGVHCQEAGKAPSPGALDTFWRSAENFKTEADYDWLSKGTGKGMLWAVSQAAPLRRVHVSNSLMLFEYVPNVGKNGEVGYASGGFLADSLVDGDIQAGSQQQWFTRNVQAKAWTGGIWNPVFVGVEGAPAAHCGKVNKTLARVVVAQTPTIAEKPYIAYDEVAMWTLRVPALSNTPSSGASWTAADPSYSSDAVYSFTQVYVATAADSAAAINKKLAVGLHVVLSPGIYELEDTLQLSTPNQVLLGLGLATLVAANGLPAVAVANVDGVRVAGVLLQAGAKPTSTLLQWGEGSYAGDAASPGILSDVFARVGGPDVTPVQVTSMIEINSSHVIGDNLWLWRADHAVSPNDKDGTVLVKDGDNPCTHGLRVYGDDVTMYGAAVEHTLGDLMQWYGERGRSYFYQSELPYDVTQANFGDRGFVGYRVDAAVTQHDAWGTGVYHYFRDHKVTVASGIAAPAALVPRFHSPLTVCLNGSGTIQHIINDYGGQTDIDNKGNPETCCGDDCRAPTNKDEV